MRLTVHAACAGAAVAYSSLSKLRICLWWAPAKCCTVALQLQWLWPVLLEEPACARRDAQLSCRYSYSASLKAACVTVQVACMSLSGQDDRAAATATACGKSASTCMAASVTCCPARPSCSAFTLQANKSLDRAHGSFEPARLPDILPASAASASLEDFADHLDRLDLAVHVGHYHIDTCDLVGACIVMG